MALRRGHLECGANCWPDAVTRSRHVYEVRPREDKRGVKQKAFSKRCVHDPLQPTLQSAQVFPLLGQGIVPIQLAVRKPTLAETIHQRPMRAGCWRLFHTHDDKITACRFRYHVCSREVVFLPTVGFFRSLPSES